MFLCNNYIFLINSKKIKIMNEIDETFNIICDYALYFKEVQKILEDRKFKYYAIFPNIHKQKKAYFYIYINYVSDKDLEFLIKLRRRVHD